MNDRPLAAVRARLEVLEAQLESSSDPQAIFDRLESLAIAILDSEYMDFREGELEEYLQYFLHQRAMELGLFQSPGKPP